MGQALDNQLKLVTGQSTEVIELVINAFADVGITGMNAVNLLTNIVTKFRYALSHRHSTCALALAQYNIDIDNGSGTLKPVNQIFPQIIAVVQQAHGDRKKIKLLNRFFGRQTGKDFCPLLNLPREQLGALFLLEPKLSLTKWRLG